MTDSRPGRAHAQAGACETIWGRGGDADPLVAPTIDDRIGRGRVWAGHRLPEPQRWPSATGLGGPYRAAAHDRASADTRPAGARESGIGPPSRTDPTGATPAAT